MERKKTCNDDKDDDDDDDDNDDDDLNEPNLGPCRINISGTSWVHPLLLDYNNFQSPTLP